MRASNGEPEGLGVTFDGRRPSWEEEVVGKSMTHRHSLPMRRGCCCRGFCWLVDQAITNPMVGSPSGYGAVAGKVPENFTGNEEV